MAPRYGGSHAVFPSTPPLFDPWRGSVVSKAGGWGGRFRVTSNQRGLWRFRRRWGAYKAVQARTSLRMALQQYTHRVCEPLCHSPWHPHGRSVPHLLRLKAKQIGLSSATVACLPCRQISRSPGIAAVRRSCHHTHAQLAKQDKQAH